MGKRNISQEKIIQAFLSNAFEKGAGATSLSDVADSLEIKKASLYNHFESRDSMYEATIQACGKEFLYVSFLSDKTLDSIKAGKNSLIPLFKRLVSRFFDLYENEPLFHMYVFIHTEQYFNFEALEIIRKENEKLTDEIRKILNAFIEIRKIKLSNDKESKDSAQILSSIILQQLDFYIANKKEVVRQNPESGTGSLFALPTDNVALNNATKVMEAYLKTISA